jgi:hypothetical protein
MNGAFASELIRRIAAEHPDVADPKNLVPYLMDELSGREEEVLRRLLPSYIANVLRRRGTATDEQAEWDGFLSERVPTAEGTIFLRDATANDLDAGAKRRIQFAGALDTRAQKFTATARAIRDAGVPTAGQLHIGDAVSMLRELEVRLRTAQRQRLTDAAKTQRLNSLRVAVAQLRDILGSGESPTVKMLRSYRDSLVQQLDEAASGLERGRQTDEWWERSVTR